eukprot:g67460.t1
MLLSFVLSLTGVYGSTSGAPTCSTTSLDDINVGIMGATAGSGTGGWSINAPAEIVEGTVETVTISGGTFPIRGITLDATTSGSGIGTIATGSKTRRGFMPGCSDQPHFITHSKVMNVQDLSTTYTAPALPPGTNSLPVILSAVVYSGSSAPGVFHVAAEKALTVVKAAASPSPTQSSTQTPSASPTQSSTQTPSASPTQSSTQTPSTTSSSPSLTFPASSSPLSLATSSQSPSTSPSSLPGEGGPNGGEGTVDDGTSSSPSQVQSDPSTSPQPAASPNALPSGRFAGCQGECYTDTDCQGTLVCMTRYADEPLPNCDTSLTYLTNTNYCVSLGEYDGLLQGYTDCLAGQGNCGACEGDCDYDTDCKEGYGCNQRSGDGGTVPGCWGTPETDFDYCVRIQKLTVVSAAPSSVPLLAQLFATVGSLVLLSSFSIVHP